MKKTVSYLLFLLLPYLLLAQYERISGVPYGISRIVNIDSLYYAGQNLSIYQSTNQGDSWSVNSQPPVLYWVPHMFAYDTLLYVSDVHGGILRSSDFGQNYTRVSDSLYGLVEHYYQFNENDIYAYNPYYVFISHDNGEHFDHFTTEGTTWGCYYDGTMSYILTGSSPQFGSSFELYRSPDHFQTNDTIPIELSVFEKPSGGIVTFHDKLVFGVDAFTRLYISSDQGTSFEYIDLVSTEETFNTRINELFPTSDTLFVATDQGVYKSGDPELAVWELLDFPFDGHLRGAPVITDVYKTGETLMVEVFNSTHFRRDADGVWEELIHIPDFNAPSSFSKLGNEIMVQGFDNKLYHSRDGGYSFELFRSPVLTNFISWTERIKVKKYGDVTFAYENVYNRPLYRHKEGDISEEEVLAVGRAVELFNDTLWALDDYRLYISIDEGESWEERADFTSYIGTGVPQNAPRGVYKIGNSVTVLLSGNTVEGRILYSDDNGFTFAEVWSEGLMPYFSAHDSIIAVYYDYYENIIVSEDAGASWQSRPAPTDNEILQELILADGILMTNTTEAIYFSNDLGQNWHLYPLPPDYLGFITAVGYYEGNWFAGISEGGIYLLNKSLIECADGQGEGCALVTGRVFHDENDNCIYDETEVALHPFILQVQPGDYQFSTDSSGLFSIGLSAGMYEISAPVPSGTYWQTICPPSGSFDLNVDANNPNNDTLNFALELLPDIYDLEANLISTGNTRINEACYFTLSCTNLGSEATAATLLFNHPASLSLLESTLTPNEQSDISLSWNVPTLEIGEQLQIELVFFLENDVDLIGQMFQLSFEANPMETDNTPSNNMDSLSLVYNGAYDPNDKQVEPLGQGASGLISPTDTSFTYTIRFQNTGNDIARRVRLVDTLATIFDPLSFRMIAASHDYQFSLDDKHVLHWDFVGINLPDSTSNEAASHGFVTFNVKLKETLMIGEAIRNDAAIYFDANPPIFTNTTLNTVSLISSVHQPQVLPTLELFPNPNQGTFNLILPTEYLAEEVSLMVYNLAGQQVYSRQMDHTPQQTVRLPDLAAGVYLLQLQTGRVAATEWTLLIIQ